MDYFSTLHSRKVFHFDMFISALLCFSFISVIWTLHLPGLAPVNYCNKDELTANCKNDITVFVNRLTSRRSALPREYYYFDHCKDENIESPVENIGQILFGDRIHSSSYKLDFKSEAQCKVLCTKSYSDSKLDVKKISRIQDAILKNYQHHWIVDDIPVTWCSETQSGHEYCTTEFPLGCYVNQVGKATGVCRFTLSKSKLKNSYVLFNHIDFHIFYRSGSSEEWGVGLGNSGGRIISVKVTPRSIKDDLKNPSCSSSELLAFNAKKPDFKTDITYTYSVKFEEKNDLKWSSRWSYMYNSFTKSNVQWFSIINSVCVVLFLSGSLAMIMIRTLYKDLARYSESIDSEEANEEYGWKLVHGDVFRSPPHGIFLSVLIGNGVQIFCMVLSTLICACLGFLSPANRGSLATCAVFLWVCLGTPSGYVSARVYKSFGGINWKSNVLLTAFLCPGIIFAIFFFLNIILWVNQSSGSVPFLTLLQMLALWFGVSVPLTFIGAYFGYKKQVFEHPVQTNDIPRQIPKQSIYTRPVAGIMMGGILPFSCIYIQLHFILNSIWSSQIYYMFGVLFVVFCILVITCAECSILLCYFHLCAEDYRWAWRSFLSSGCTALYFLVSCTHYYVTTLSITSITSTMIYFGYTFIMIFVFFILAGSIGFISCYWFVKKIYSYIKVD